MSRNAYQDLEIRTASPEMLVAKLYERTIRHCRAAAEHIEHGRIEERAHSIAAALRIVGELQNALDHEQGGEIAGNLDALYVFVADRLLKANFSDGREALGEAESVLSELHGAWDRIARGDLPPSAG